MNGILLLTGMSLSLDAKLAALTYLALAYSRSKRRSALLFGLTFPVRFHPNPRGHD